MTESSSSAVEVRGARVEGDTPAVGGDRGDGRAACSPAAPPSAGRAADERRRAGLRCRARRRPWSRRRRVAREVVGVRGEGDVAAGRPRASPGRSRRWRGHPPRARRGPGRPWPRSPAGPGRRPGRRRGRGRRAVGAPGASAGRARLRRGRRRAAGPRGRCRGRPGRAGGQPPPRPGAGRGRRRPPAGSRPGPPSRRSGPPWPRMRSAPGPPRARSAPAPRQMRSVAPEAAHEVVAPEGGDHVAPGRAPQHVAAAGADDRRPMAPAQRAAVIAAARAGRRRCKRRRDEVDAGGGPSTSRRRTLATWASSSAERFSAAEAKATKESVGRDRPGRGGRAVSAGPPIFRRPGSPGWWCRPARSRTKTFTDAVVVLGREVVGGRLEGHEAPVGRDRRRGGRAVLRRPPRAGPPARLTRVVVPATAGRAQNTLFGSCCCRPAERLSADRLEGHEAPVGRDHRGEGVVVGAGQLLSKVTTGERGGAESLQVAHEDVRESCCCRPGEGCRPPS